MKAKVLDVSSWKREVHLNTSGTRDKNILTCPKGDKYFFKKSLRKPNKDYKFEFWSEIIASQIGAHLGFNVVKYHVAYFNNEIGCISKSIINSKQDEELIEGYRYIIEKYPDFQYNFRKTHSFQKIKGSLKNQKLDFLLKDLLNLVVFDAIIGNTDRHSENWGVVVSNKGLKEAIKSIESMSKIMRIMLNMRFFFLSRGKLSLLSMIEKLKHSIFFFSPLYDNGSSLARELDEKRINELMSNDEKMDNFIDKGKPDIRWNDKYLNHFSLVQTLKLDYPNEINSVLNRVETKYNKNVIKGIIQNVDNKIPERFSDYKIPQERKDFIIKYIYARINVLLDIDNYEHI